jgi:hypothetical protein
MIYLTAETLSLNAYSPFFIEKHLAYLQLSLVRPHSPQWSITLVPTEISDQIIDSKLLNP